MWNFSEILGCFFYETIADMFGIWIIWEMFEFMLIRQFWL